MVYTTDLSDMPAPQLGFLLLATCSGLLAQSLGQPVTLPVSFYGHTDTNLTNRRSDSSTALVAAGEGILGFGLAAMLALWGMRS